jgi:biopolymer transport protein ExbB
MPSKLIVRRYATVVLALMAVFFLLMFAGPVFAQDGGGGEAPAASGKNIFVHIIESAGWIFGPLLILMSIFLVVLIVLLTLDLRMSVAIPPGFVDEFIDTVNKRRFKEAFEMARNDTSFLGRVLTAGMSRLQYGLEDARDAAMNMLESIRSGKEQLNNYTAVLGSLGPLVGLVGTVLGMIRSFIALAEGRGLNPALLSKGISEALSITFLGIAISVPAIFFNAFFRNRIVKVSMDTGHIADDLLTQMYHNSKKAGGPPTTGSTMGPASPPPPTPPVPAR